MKNFSKISSVIILAAASALFSSTATADDIAVKPLRYQGPAKSQFAEKVSEKAVINCPACKTELISTVTSDAKLKTKTALVANHGCSQCKTTIVRSGAQKATGKDVARHTCGALVAAVENCCAGMK